MLSCLQCEPFCEFLQESNFSMGYGGTHSVIRYDADNIMHCLVACGRKDWMLVAHEDRQLIKYGRRQPVPRFRVLSS